MWSLFRRRNTDPDLNALAAQVDDAFRPVVADAQADVNRGIDGILELGLRSARITDVTDNRAGELTITFGEVPARVRLVCDDVEAAGQLAAAHRLSRNSPHELRLSTAFTVADDWPHLIFVASPWTVYITPHAVDVTPHP